VTSEIEHFAFRFPPPVDNPWSRLGHVLDLYADQADDAMALLATQNIYPDQPRTGLTFGDLRAINNGQFTGGGS
jgi:hypothetical protein